MTFSKTLPVVDRRLIDLKFWGDPYLASVRLSL